MQIQHSHFGTSASLRNALKRGLARQAMSHAAQAEADVAALVRISTNMRPNAKAMQRLAQQLASRKGVVKVAKSNEGLVVIVRNVCQIRNQIDQQDLFRETALVYTRLAIRCLRHAVGYHVSRASFCLHALERLVERSPVALDRPLLPVADQEAVRVLRGLAQGRDFTENGDHFIPAVANGVWAGGLDQAALDEEWGLVCKDAAGVPLFSARTFLSEDEMRPTVWYSWKQETSDR